VRGRKSDKLPTQPLYVRKVQEELESPFDDAEFQNSYLTGYEYADDDFTNDNEDDFADDNEFIYCTPSYEACYYSNLIEGCGINCQGEYLESYVVSGYYVDMQQFYPSLNWLQSFAFDFECDVRLSRELKLKTISGALSDERKIEIGRIYSGFVKDTGGMII